jgi:hypothetical protein
MSEDPIRRGVRWKLFLEEEGGVNDMLAEIRQTYLERIAAADPRDTGRLQVLAMAHRVSRELEAMIRDIVTAGEVATAARDYANKMEKIPQAARRRL